MIVERLAINKLSVPHLKGVAHLLLLIGPERPRVAEASAEAQVKAGLFNKFYRSDLIISLYPQKIGSFWQLGRRVKGNGISTRREKSVY
jgi:hypothetical protein